MSIVKINHNAGFFSCCSVKLTNTINFINLNNKIPDIVDSSEQFNYYKTNNDKDLISLNEMIEYYNNWSTDKLQSNPFAKRINNHIKTERKRIDNKQSMCICSYKWNTVFKENYSNSLID